MRYLSLALLLFLPALAAGQAQDSAVNGTWTAEFRTARVFLQLRTSRPDADGVRSDWTTGQPVAIDDFAGLPAGDDSFSASNLKFELRREAGTLAFDGAFRDGRGAGLFTFMPRPEYTAEMRALGYSDALPTWRRFQLAVHDVGPRYIRALRTEGYDKLVLDDIQRGLNHGVTLDYIRAMKTEGYRNIPWDTLVRTRDHGVTSSYVQGLRRAGFANLPLEDLVRAKDHGVTPEFIQELTAEKMSSATLEGYVRLRDHGVSAEYIADMREIGLNDLTAQQVVRLRDHGITPGFVNHARARGFKESSVEELIRLKNTGLWR